MGAEIEQLAGDILSHPRFQQLRMLVHHGPQNSVYDHSVAVAKAAYALSRRMRLSVEETVSVVRAALLHDFFEYDWRSAAFRRFLRRYSGLKRLLHMHGFVHGSIAAERARACFGLTERECEAIARHMFPLSPMPRTRIAWIVTLCDKTVAAREMTLAVRVYLSLACRKVFA